MRQAGQTLVLRMDYQPVLACRAGWDALGRWDQPFFDGFGDRDRSSTANGPPLIQRTPGAASQPTPASKRPLRARGLRPRSVRRASSHPDRGAKGITASMVHQDAPGLVRGDPEKKVGTKGSPDRRTAFRRLPHPRSSVQRVRHPDRVNDPKPRRRRRQPGVTTTRPQSRPPSAIWSNDPALLTLIRDSE